MDPDNETGVYLSRLHVVSLALLAALGAFRFAVAARLDVNNQGFVASLAPSI